MSVGEGTIGVCVCFEAPIMQRMFALSLAWHWHSRGTLHYTLCEHMR